MPEFLDLVIWGHEHECLIEPTLNAETNFHVMQPGSSVATSLMPGEAVPKHVAILSITGKDFKVDPIRLKTVRPFVMKEIVLAEEKEALRLAKKPNHRSELTRFLEAIVNSMIEEAKGAWEEAQGEELEEDEMPPLPLIRLRVEFTPPDGLTFDCENPQRFSSRFSNRVANTTDVVQFHRKKSGTLCKMQAGADLPEDSALASLADENVKVERIIREFLTSQPLTILPRGGFGDAVAQYVDKDDKYAMESFVGESLKRINENIVQMDLPDDEALAEGMEATRSLLEKLFESGQVKLKNKRHPRPDDWDSDLQGEWDMDPRAIIRSDDDSDAESEEVPASKKVVPAAKGRSTAANTKKAAPARKAAPAPAKSTRGKKKVAVSSDEDEDDQDVVMVDSDNDSELFVKSAPSTRGKKTAAPAPAPAKKTPAPRGAAARSMKQSQLSFSQAGTGSKRTNGKTGPEVGVEEISDDDDDAFESAPPTRPSRGRK